jgi:DNA polymerase sigma
MQEKTLNSEVFSFNFDYDLDVVNLLDVSQLLVALGCLVYFIFFRLCPKKSSRGTTHTKRLDGDPQKHLPRAESRRITQVPVSGATFVSKDFESQVQELLSQVTPTKESEEVVKSLARHAQSVVQEVFPTSEVVGFASSNIVRGTAFGVAVPDVDLVASIRPDELVRQMQLQRSGQFVDKLCARKLQKSAVRMCTDLLTTKGSLKFRRTFFRGEEPKVTLLVPPNLGFSAQSIPLDFSVNSVLPLHSAALLTECGQREPRAKSLIIFVRRWVKDRGICQASMGHMPPYAWTLLCIYFCQVGIPGARLLPPVKDFKVAADLGRREVSARMDVDVDLSHTNRMQVGELFQRFVIFTRGIDWSKEAPSVRVGQRAPANLWMEIPVIVREDGLTEVGPCVEDPFFPQRNLASGVTEYGAKRFQEEIQRACSLTSNGASLAELLEPWTPPGSQPHPLCQKAEW